MRKIAVLTLLLFGNACAFELPVVPSSTELETASRVAYGVDVTTGCYVEVAPELVVNCHEPILLFRSHISGERRPCPVYKRWTKAPDSRPMGKWKREIGEMGAGADWHFEREVIKLFVDRGGKNPVVELTEATGKRIAFKPRGHYNYVRFGGPHTAHYVETAACNNTAGHISGQTNIKNYDLRFDPNAYQFSLRTGTGEWRTYKCFKYPSEKQDKRGRNKEKIDVRFYLTEVVRPSGNRLKYVWDEASQQLLEIRSESANGRVTFGWVRFDHRGPYTSIKTSDGQHLKRYSQVFTTGCETDDAQYWAELGTTHVGSARDGQSEKIQHFYDHNFNHIATHIWNQNGPDFELRYFADEEHAHHGRVSESRCGDESLAQFAYTIGAKGEDRFVASPTYVGDALRDQRFSFDRHRLLEVTIAEPGSLPRRQERLEWQDNDSLRSSLAVGEGNVRFERTFEYDCQYNVIQETQCGTGEPLLTTCYTYSYDGLNACLSRSDGRSCTEYAYKPGTNLLASVRVIADGEVQEEVRYDYDENACLTSVRQNDGFVERLTRITPVSSGTAIGLPETIESFYLDGEQPVLLSKEVRAYDSRNLLVRRDIYDADNVFRYATAATYDEKARLIKAVDPLGNTLNVSYPGHEVIVEHGDFSTRCAFDVKGRLTHKVIGGLSCSYEYDIYGNRTLEKDECGSVTRYEYDALHKPVVITHADGRVTRREYDGFGHLIKEISPSGEAIIYRRTASGQPLSITYSDGSHESFTYNSHRELIEKMHRDGTRTLFERDYKGRSVRVQFYSADNELVKTESATYLGDQIASWTDAMGVTTLFTYDRASRLVKKQRGLEETNYAYNALGQCVREIQNGRVTAREYDLVGRVTEERVEEESGSLLLLKQFEYDGRGNCTCETCYSSLEAPCKTISVFDAFNQVKEEIDPLGHKTSYAWDSSGVGRVTYPDGHEKRIDFDALGRPTMISEASRSVTYSYDPGDKWVRAAYQRQEGQPLIHKSLLGPGRRKEAFIEGEKRTTRYEYDAASRLVATLSASGERLSYGYDDFGRLQTHTGPDYSDTYAYDLCDRITSIVSNQGKTGRAYSREGHLIGEQLANGLELRYEVDPFGRRTRIWLPDGSSIAYEYDAAFLRSVSRVDCAGNISFRQVYDEYDLRGLPKRIFPILGKQPLTFCWDLAGQLTAVEGPWYAALASYDVKGNPFFLSGCDSIGQFETSFNFDALDQVIRQDDRLFQYDALSNRTEQTAVDELTQLLASPQGEFTYDGNGRTIRISTGCEAIALQYDSLDRLTAVESEKLRLLYTYDPLGRRLSKTTMELRENKWVQRARLRFLWVDGFEIGAVDDQGQIVELRVMGVGLGAEKWATVAIELDGVPYQPVHDFQGNVAGLVGFDGKVAEAYRYSAFGETTANSPLGNPWRYAGKRLDEESSFVYFGHRYYLPSTGRWLTPDPLGFPDGPNAYAFCGNNPLRMSDEDGLKILINAPAPDCPFLPQAGRLPPAYEGRITPAPRWSPCIPPLMDLGSISLDQRRKRHPYYAAGPQAYSTRLTHDLRREENYPLRSHWFDLSHLGRPSHPDMTFVFVNGMCNSKDEALSHAIYYSNLSGGYNVNVIYNATTGFSGDRKEAQDNLGFCCTAPVYELISHMREWLANAPPDHKLTICCHSQGSVITRNALMFVSEEERQRILVICIAPSAYIWPTLSLRQTHIVLENTSQHFDIVPHFDWIGKEICRETTIRVKSAPDAPWFDHAFQSPTYHEAFAWALNHYMHTYKRKREEEE